MVQEYVLYNFDHGFQKARKFKIGKYEIEISDEQGKNLANLEKNAKRIFSMDEDLSRFVEKEDYKRGDILETATLRVSDDELHPSVLYTDLPERNAIDDFIIFLSFITGRRVFLDRDLGQDNSTKYFDRVVNQNYFNFPVVKVEEGFSKRNYSPST